LNKAKAYNSAAAISTIHNSNVACCTIPPVVSAAVILICIHIYIECYNSYAQESDYTAKGDFISYAGFNKVYVTGDSKEKVLGVSLSINYVYALYTLF
jgi:hypothetical protein